MSFSRELTSPEHTRAVAASLAAVLEAGDLIGLVGDLGAGKTLFVQGLAAALELPEGVRVTSPTFTLINEYRGGHVPIYHVDIYRLDREIELDELGLDEIVRRGDGVVLVEWCDKFRVLPRDHVNISLRVTGPETRALEVTAGGKRSEALAEAWRAAIGS